MPQVDKVTLMPQVFWLVFLFLGVYFYVSRTRLKPFLFYIKFNYSLLLMNIYFYIKLCVANVSYQTKSFLLTKFLTQQSLILTYLAKLDFLLNTNEKYILLSNYNNFLTKYAVLSVSLVYQNEKFSKNII